MSPSAITLDIIFKALVIGALGIMWWQLRGWFIRLEQGQRDIHDRIDKLDKEHDTCKTETVQRLTRLETRVDGLEKGNGK